MKTRKISILAVLLLLFIHSTFAVAQQKAESGKWSVGQKDTLMIGNYPEINLQRAGSSIPNGGTDNIGYRLTVVTPLIMADLSVTTHGNEAGPVDAVFTVTLSKTNTTGSPIIFDFNTADNTATDGSDYAAVSGGVINVADGADTGAITVPVIDDAIYEGAETVDGTISNPSDPGVTINTATATADITDNESLPAVSINDVTVTEGDAATVNAVFTVTLSPPSQREVRVDYITNDSTTTKSIDYQFNSAFIYIRDTETITVKVNGDTQDEEDEIFFVNLWDYVGQQQVNFVDAIGRGKIIDDDAAPEIDIQRPAGTSIADGDPDDVGDQLLGPVNLTYMVDNSTGTDELDVTDVTVSKFINSENFVLGTTMPLSIAAGTTETFNISFDIKALGAFSFDMEIDNNDSNENPYEIQVNGMGRLEYTLTMAVAPRDHWGNTNPPEGDHVYLDGTVVKIEAQPGLNRQFVRWIGDVANPNSRQTTVTMDGDKTVTAEFEWIDYTLTMAVSPEGGGTTDPIVGEHRYHKATIVDITATPAPGYTFIGWAGNVTDPASATTTVRMFDHETVTARFEGSDAVSPYLAFYYPVPDGVSIPQNTTLQFKAEDAGRGVDLSTLDFSVNGEAIITGGVDRTGGCCEITAFSPQYHVLYTPLVGFLEDSEVTVAIFFSDLAAPENSFATTHSFFIGSALIDTTTVAAQGVGEAGGTILDVESDIEMIIPAGAMEDSLDITICEVDSLPPLPEAYAGIGLNFHFGPDGMEFNDSVTVRIPYTQEDLDNAGVATPEELELWYYHTTSGEWVALAVVDVDNVNQYIYVKVDKFCYLTFATLKTNIQPDVDGLLPTAFHLEQNYPNPFNPETTIGYEMSQPGHVEIAVYDLIGRKIRMLLAGEMPAGRYEILWDGRDIRQQPVATGIYLIIMQAEDQRFIRKVTMLK